MRFEISKISIHSTFILTQKTVASIESVVEVMMGTIDNTIGTINGCKIIPLVFFFEY